MYVCVQLLFIGEHLRVCSHGGRFTCCTLEMENKLVSRTRTEFNQRLSEVLGIYQRTYTSQVDTFDSTFTLRYAVLRYVTYLPDQLNSYSHTQSSYRPTVGNIICLCERLTR